MDKLYEKGGKTSATISLTIDNQPFVVLSL